MHIHTKKLVMRGELLQNARRAMILVHGRGATAENILEVTEDLMVDDFALLAPQASDQCWYSKPYDAPMEENQPELSSAVAVLEELVDDTFDNGLHARELYFLGFSQGACVVAEYIARHARQYGGVFMLSGGLMGETIDPSAYDGKFYGTHIFLGCGDADPHISVERVEQTANIFEQMGGQVEQQLNRGTGHRIVAEALQAINDILCSRDLDC